MTKKMILAGVLATTAFLPIQGETPKLQLDFSAERKIKLKNGGRDLFLNDNLNVFDKNWKCVLPALSGKPESSRDGECFIDVWSRKNSKVSRRAETLPDGKIRVSWEIELAPVAGGRFVELTVVGIAAHFKPIEPTGKTALFASRHGFAVPLKSGDLILNFKGGDRGWTLEDRRKTPWLKNYRLWQLCDFKEEGMKYKAEIIFGGTPGDILPPPATAGAGSEYQDTRIILEPQVTDATLPANVSVNTSKKIRRFDSALFGLNHDWSGSKELAPYAGKAYEKGMKIVPDYAAATLRNAPLPVNRMAGSDSQYFQWKKAIGPLETRLPHKTMSWERPEIQTFGLVEWIASTRETDPSARFVWVLNMLLDSPEDARDLAEFLTGDASTPWGKKRVESGLEKPVFPMIWELGNELDWGNKAINIDEYIAKCKVYMAAVRQVIPNAKFAALAVTAPWAERQKKQWPQWNQKVLAALGKEIAYMAFHPYYRGHSQAYLKKYMDDLAEDICKSPNPNIEVFISEHAKWPPHSEKGHNEWRKHWFQTHALTGCLDTAEWFALCMNRPEVTVMAYHNWSSGPWGFLKRDGNGKLYTTGIMELFKLLGHLPDGGDVVQMEFSGEHTQITDPNFSLTGAAVQSGNQLRLLLNNRLPTTERKLNFNFNGQHFRVTEGLILTAPHLFSVNGPAGKDITVQPLAFEPGEFSAFTLPPRSLVLLSLEPIQI